MPWINSCLQLIFCVKMTVTWTLTSSIMVLLKTFTANLQKLSYPSPLHRQQKPSKNSYPASPARRPGRRGRLPLHHPRKSRIQTTIRNIERQFGSAKEYHGLRYTNRCGRKKIDLKAVLTFACMNMKKLTLMMDRRDRERAALLLLIYGKTA